MTHAQVEQFKFFISHNYTYTLFLDDLPSATVNRDPHNKTLVDYLDGIPIGVYSRTLNKVMIYNHLNITVFTHTTLEGFERIVGFHVEPMSIGEGKHRQLYDPARADDVQWLEPGKEFRFSFRIRTVVSFQCLFVLPHFIFNHCAHLERQRYKVGDEIGPLRPVG